VSRLSRIPKIDSMKETVLEVLDGSNEALALARVRAHCANGTARAARLGARLSLAEVAKAVGASSQVTVLRWERGERLPRGDLALRYGRLLDDLIGRQR